MQEQNLYSIDKNRFAEFLSELRKEKGYTQKELAAKLFISDKAVSKWERGLSLPDTALLIPLSEVLGVTVTELLKGEHLQKDSRLNIKDVEELVVNTIDISKQEIEKKTIQKKTWKKIYIACSCIALVQILLIYLFDNHIFCELYNLLLGTGMLVLFGFWFCIKIREHLPKYYDEYKVCSYSDGIFRMNLPGICFNNSNWPHIVSSARVWICSAIAIQPVITLAVYLLLPMEMKLYANFVVLPAVLGMFVPMIYSAYRYQ